MTQAKISNPFTKTVCKKEHYDLSKNKTIIELTEMSNDLTKPKNDYINSYIRAMDKELILEAVKHFISNKMCWTEDTESRFFFHKSEVEDVKKLIQQKGYSISNLKTIVIRDECNPDRVTYQLMRKELLKKIKK